LWSAVIVLAWKPALSKSFSTDGGDTIRFEPIHNEEAHVGLPRTACAIQSQTGQAEGSLKFSPSAGLMSKKEEDEQVQNFQLPDFIAAEQYRKKQLEKNRGLKTAVSSAATKLKNAGNIKDSDVD
jgi:hypothetical protein